MFVFSNLFKVMEIYEIYTKALCFLMKLACLELKRAINSLTERDLIHFKIAGRLYRNFNLFIKEKLSMSFY